jgi:uncharacterized protein (UPF0210 family)
MWRIRTIPVILVFLSIGMSYADEGIMNKVITIKVYVESDNDDELKQFKSDIEEMINESNRDFNRNVEAIESYYGEAD